MKIIPAIALSALLAGCVAPVKPAVNSEPVASSEESQMLVLSCIEFGQFTVTFYDREHNSSKVVFLCEPVRNKTKGLAL